LQISDCRFQIVDLKEKISELLPGKVYFEVPMKDYTSFQVGGVADCLVFPQGLEELTRLVDFIGDRNLPYLVIGRGTNLLVRDGGVRGLVISLSRGFREIEVKDEEIMVGAGTPLSRLLKLAQTQGLTGLEDLAGIPGTVGGALTMNAGAGSTQLGELVDSLRWIGTSGEVVQIKKEGLNFSYRDLELPRGTIILGATLRLDKGDREGIRSRIVKNLLTKKKTQPLDQLSAGCIFRNPPERFAGKLIEEAGLKGVRVRGAKISELHANFIVNTGEARARDILILIDLIKEKVSQKTGISLVPEVKVIGED